MVQKLASMEPALVEHEKHRRGSDIWQTGRPEIIRHHRLLELFLQEKLGYSWDEVHGEADRLEHVISEELEERISHSLGNPSYDPHGHPIPSREFQIPELAGVRLSELRPGDQATVRRMSDTDPDLLRYLASIGLVPYSRVTVLDFSPYDGNLRLQVEGGVASLVLGRG
jgi:DtxR family Mn-dependent transcriptional regulator